MSSALCSGNSVTYNNMFPTKTSRYVGMVDGVSDATGSSMEKPTGGKTPGTRCISCLCNNPVNIRCLQDTLWIHFHHPYIWQHFDVALLSWPQHMCVTISICPPTHARKMIMDSIRPVANHLTCTGGDIMSDSNIHVVHIPND